MDASTAVKNNVDPYRRHGVKLEHQEGDDQAVGDCPFCGREGKFSVEASTGKWRCWVCDAGAGKDRAKPGGNLLGFVRELFIRSDEATKSCSELAAERGLEEETLIFWHVCRSIIDGRWMVPGWGPDGRLCQLYRWGRSKEGKSMLFATPGLHAGLFGAGDLDPNKPDLWLCEGPWDAMALWSTLRKVKRVGDKLYPTANPSGSLLSEVNVLAVPGCNSFQESWLPLFAGKRVILAFDNDHPRPHPTTGKTMAPAALEGMKRACRLFSGAEDKPESVHFLRWGDEHEWSPLLPAGYDVRDLARDLAGSGEGPVGTASKLLELVKPVPDDWLPGRTGAAAKAGKVDLDCLPCSDWATLRNSWLKALKWTEGLDRALSVMLASITSTRSVGDQLWCKIIGPAACGKSTLCEALSVNKQHVTAKSTIRGFHSGFQVDREGKEDCSLLATLKNKTLVTKDGDTLLQSPNLGQILSEARDIYDRVSRTHYRNKMGRDYEGINMTWLLCGTSSLRSMDSSELGERFLDCVIVEEIDEDLEDEIAMRVAYRAEREMAFVSDGKPESRDGPEMVQAKRLTGGYVGWLRENAQNLLEAVESSDEALRRCASLGKFVAYVRARFSLRQAEKAEREMSFRLVSQMVRLAKCLAVVLNRPSLDEEVMRRVTRVALDTARGRTLQIIRHLHKAGEAGLETSTIAVLTNESEDEERKYLRFLGKIKAIERFRPAKVKGKPASKPRWKLTKRMKGLYDEVVVKHEELLKGER